MVRKRDCRNDPRRELHCQTLYERLWTVAVLLQALTLSASRIVRACPSQNRVDKNGWLLIGIVVSCNKTSEQKWMFQCFYYLLRLESFDVHVNCLLTACTTGCFDETVPWNGFWFQSKTGPVHKRRLMGKNVQLQQSSADLRKIRSSWLLGGASALKHGERHSREGHGGQ